MKNDLDLICAGWESRKVRNQSATKKMKAVAELLAGMVVIHLIVAAAIWWLTGFDFVIATAIGTFTWLILPMVLQDLKKRGAESTKLTQGGTEK